MQRSIMILVASLSFSVSCIHTMHFDGVIGWKPVCEIDGTFSIKQCRGDKLTGRSMLFTFVSGLVTKLFVSFQMFLLF